MHRLAIAFTGALISSAPAFGLAAQAQTSEACDRHEAAIYFAPDSSALNAYAGQAVDRMAAIARACSVKTVEVDASAGIDRAKAVALALDARGIKAVIVPAPALAPAGDSMLSRSITLRLPRGASVNS